VNEVVAVAVLPAASTAVLETVTGPGGNEEAGALTPWHGVATPESASPLVQPKLTV